MDEREEPLRPYPESKSWRIWVDDLMTKAHNTRRHYIRDFLDFLERWDTDPEALFRLKLWNMTSPDQRDRRVVEGLVKVSMTEIRN